MIFSPTRPPPSSSIVRFARGARTRFSLATACLLVSGSFLLAEDKAPMDADSVAYMKLQPPPSATPSTPEAMREGYRRARLKYQPDLPQVYLVKEYEATGPNGPIPLRLYRGAGT